MLHTFEAKAPGAAAPLQEMTSAMDILRRLLGEPGAELLQRWAKGRARQAVQAVAPR